MTHRWLLHLSRAGASRAAARTFLALSLALTAAACGDDDDGGGDEDATSDVADTGGGDAGTDTGETDTVEDTGGTDTIEDTGGTDTIDDADAITDVMPDGDVIIDVTPDADVIEDVDDINEDVTPDADVMEDADVLADADAVEDVAPDADVTEDADAADDATDVVDTGLAVFDDDYRLNTSFVDFGGSTNAVAIDFEEAYAGGASLRIEVPAGNYTGGALVASTPVDVSTYDAVQFWAKAAGTHYLNAAGFGNDTAATFFQLEIRGNAGTGAVELTEEWQQYTIPLMNPELLTELAGLFHFAEGSDEGAYTLWIDEVEYVNLGDAIGAPSSAAFGTTAQEITVGGTARPDGLVATVPIGGVETTIYPTQVHFDWASDNVDVATVDGAGVVTGVSAGTAVITGSLNGVAAGGTLTVTVVDPVEVPTPETDGPDTGLAPGDVVAALYSDEFDTVTVDSYAREWGVFTAFSNTDLGDGDNVLFYEGLNFVGMETVGANSLDLSAATHVRFDIWTPNATSIGFKLVDAGANNTIDGAGTDDREGRVALNADATPPLTTETWITYVFSLDTFQQDGTPITLGNMSQYILDALVDAAPGVANVYIDNIVFYTEPL